MIAAALLAYAALLIAAAPRLARAAWPDRAPRLGIAAWLALSSSAIASVLLAGIALVLPTARVSDGLAWLLAACEMVLRDQYAHPGGTGTAAAGGVLAVTVAARLAWSAAATLGRAARAGRRHRRRLLLAARRDPGLGAFVVEHAEPAAYCVPGTGQPVVLTTAALRLLSQAQLAAVLAHERAHQSGRHHLLVALAVIPAAAFPRVPAFRLARDEVARLAELAADDAAAARSPRLTVAEALLNLAAAPAGAAALAPAGVAALAAGGATAAARVRRLIAAPNPLSRAARTGGALAVATLLALPLILLAAPAASAFHMGYCPMGTAAAPQAPASPAQN